MDELEKAIRQAISLGIPWKMAQVGHLLQCITSRLPGAVYDWEEGNENWGSVYFPQGMIAYVSAKMPLILVKKPYFQVVCECASPTEAILLSVTDFDTQKYCVAKELLQTIFRSSLTSVVNYDTLSLRDLWFATITA